MNVWQLRWRAVFPAALAAFCLASNAHAQPVQIKIPEGRRHFIVLVDASSQMVQGGGSLPDPEGASMALSEAEGVLASLLYTPDRVVKGPWYRGPKDYITVVQAGIYASETDQPDGLFLRRAIWADTNVGRRRFLAALRPKQRPNSNNWAWALPIGLSAAAIPGVPVQDTFVLVLGKESIAGEWQAFERPLANLKLSAAAARNLEKRKAGLRNSVQLMAGVGSNNNPLARTFGEGSAQVCISVLHAESLITQATEGALSRLHPLDTANVGGDDQGLFVDLATGSQWDSAHAKLAFRAGQTETSAEFTMAPKNHIRIKSVGGNDADLILTVNKSVSNPILGKQQIQAVYRRGVLLPPGIRLRWLFASLFGLVLVAIGLGRLYYRAVVIWHFHLWLPGYVADFELPSLVNRATSKQILRQRGEIGDIAAVLTLPSPLIRWLFYRNTRLTWDPMLRISEIPDVTTAKLTELPTTVKLNWFDLTSTSGEFTLTIERRVVLGRNPRAQVRVRFLSSTPPNELNQENL